MIFAVLGALLILPAAGFIRLALVFDPWILGGYVGFASVVGFLVHWHDKRRAESGGWRTPEATLHWVELLGGWPGAFLAQHALRHKVSKTRYQVNFWAIVAFHQMVALDCTLRWRYARQAMAFLGGGS